MLAKLKAIQDGIIIAGDGRHDSTGHSAKFGAYTISCCTVPMIIYFSLVQVRYIFYHYYFWVMHLQCSSLLCHFEIHILYRVHNLCTLLFYSQMHFFNLLIDLTKGHQYMTVFLLWLLWSDFIFGSIFSVYVILFWLEERLTKCVNQVHFVFPKQNKWSIEVSYNYFGVTIYNHH